MATKTTTPTTDDIFDPMPLTVSARLREPAARADVYEDGSVRIRIGDGRDSAFWAEVVLTAAQIEELSRRCYIAVKGA